MSLEQVYLNSSGKTEAARRLVSQETGAGNEIQLTDAMIELASRQPFYGLKFEGSSFDCGSKIGFLAANVAYALARADIGDQVRVELARIVIEQAADGPAQLTALTMRAVRGTTNPGLAARVKSRAPARYKTTSAHQPRGEPRWR